MGYIFEYHALYLGIEQTPSCLLLNKDFFSLIAQKMWEKGFENIVILRHL